MTATEPRTEAGRRLITMLAQIDPEPQGIGWVRDAIVAIEAEKDAEYERVVDLYRRQRDEAEAAQGAAPHAEGLICAACGQTEPPVVEVPLHPRCAEGAAPRAEGLEEGQAILDHLLDGPHRTECYHPGWEHRIDQYREAAPRAGGHTHEWQRVLPSHGTAVEVCMANDCDEMRDAASRAEGLDTETLERAAKVAEDHAERLKHTSHRDGLGMGWLAGEELCRDIAVRIRSLARPSDDQSADQ